MGLGTWIANLVTGGDYDRRNRLLVIERDLLRREISAWKNEARTEARVRRNMEMSRDAYRQVGQAQKRSLQLKEDQRYMWENDARRYAQNVEYWAGRFSGEGTLPPGLEVAVQAEVRAMGSLGPGAGGSGPPAGLRPGRDRRSYMNIAGNPRAISTAGRRRPGRTRPSSWTLMGQVRQSDGNTQRVEAERDEAVALAESGDWPRASKHTLTG